jgi:hypothetical protein
MNEKDEKKNVKWNNKRLPSKYTFSDAKLTIEVEDSDEVEGDVSVLLSRSFLFIARAQALSNWHKLVGV